MNGVLYYFSGTGNTKWIADKFKYYFQQKKITLDLISIEELEDISLKDYDFLILGTPVYAELSPKIVDSFVNDLPESKSNMKTIIYSTQGADKASAVDILEENIKQKGYDVIGKAMFKMNNNYYFAVGKKVDINEINNVLKNADKKVEYVVNQITKGKKFYERTSIFRNVLAKVVGRMFIRFIPKMSKNLTSTMDCRKCGLCLRNCPQSNITLENGHAVFHSKCILCLRCIHICPINAIRYKGKKIEQTQKEIIKTKLKLK